MLRKTGVVAASGPGDYFDGEVDFDLIVDGAVHRGLVAKVKQAGGSSFADPLEVLSPRRYIGPFHYGKFRDCVEHYVREQVTTLVAGSRRPLARNVRIDNVRLPGEEACNFAV